MKEEIRRIMKLVQEGRLSPEDAAELIDAFTASEAEEGQEQRSAPREGAGSTSEAKGTQADSPSDRDPFKRLVDFMEGLGKEVSESVNWHDVARQARDGAKKGLEELRSAAAKIKEGKFHWFGAYEVREVTLPLRIPEGKALRVENPCGDVKITGVFEDGSVKALARVRGSDEAEARENADAYTVIIEESDHQVLLRQPDISGIDVDLEIQLPRACPIEVRTSSGDVKVVNSGAGARVQVQSGDIQLRGLDGAVEVTSQSGDVRIEDVATPGLTLENKSGDIALVHVRGNINARSASGDVVVRESTGKTISIESVSGDVNADLSEPITGTVSIRTVNGQASLAIADGSDCRVSLSTLRGDVHCDVILKDESRMEQHVTGRLGEGTGSLDVSAVNGNITMRLREHAASATT